MLFLNRKVFFGSYIDSSTFLLINLTLRVIILLTAWFSYLTIRCLLVTVLLSDEPNKIVVGFS